MCAAPAVEAGALIRIVAEEVHARASAASQVLVVTLDGEYAPEQLTLPYSYAMGRIVTRENIADGHVTTHHCNYLQSSDDRWYFSFRGESRGVILRIEERLASPPRQYFPFRPFPERLQRPGLRD